ncbi:MAG: methyltransferase domain-containing protein [Roseibium sp.]|uniref:methyltransferase domain-containing protein n=1 Tax=Roseibium sp. TaxID=1936156 RepID=UPI002612CE66|nr:methyltransferase domain-containing protein [Roseibium sp.]MCV0424483.1 methyltransferase domain-containing protein [Roseibium sp.]
MLKFNARTTKLLENAYLGADFSRRRRASFEALCPRPGDRIADIGCGNGLLTQELARTLGETGKVFGIDPSDNMRKAAHQRCSDLPNVEILDGTANTLGLESNSVDRAVSLQMFEYLDDLQSAAVEAHRVLKPGGRLVVGDMHWDTLTWFSDYPERMHKMLVAWDRHLIERCVPAVLPPILQTAGFVVEQVTPVPFSATGLHPDGLPNMMINLMVPFVIEKDLVPEEEAREWALEQKKLDASGRMFFSITHFVIVARKT